MRPLIGITCNYDYRDTVGTASSMGTVGRDWNFWLKIMSMQLKKQMAHHF